MARLKDRVIVAVKRAIRPFVPDGVVARLRRSGFSAQARVNVDVVEDDARQRRLWLRSTPDTYRVRTTASFAGAAPATPVTVVGEPVGEGPVVALARRTLSEEEARRLLLPLADPAVMTSVLGEAAPPKVDRGRGNEPVVAPLAVALRMPMWDEIGPAGDLVAILERARAAGHRLALTPLRGAGGLPAGRQDPVEGRGAVVILAVVPLHDVGGGSRSAQLALELAARGYHVVYAAMYGTHESVDLGIRYLHPLLEQVAAEDFDAGAFARRVTGDGPRLVIVEMPHAGFLPLIETLRGQGFRVVYDLIDDWSDPALGGWWFKPEHEIRLIEVSDGLVASAPPLVERLERLSGSRPVVEVPNGVNARLFAGPPGPVPPDLPRGDGPVLEYHGSLYGSWFDWDALAGVARARPDARVVVIGDEREHPPMPPNVWFLGLKAQKDLPDYLAHADVGLIPFKVNSTTHAVSPLKAFEYLASGVPVAAPPLRPLEGLDGVHLDADLRVAVERGLAAPRPDREAALAAHGWGERLDRLFGSAGLTLESGAGSPVRVIRRPAVHYRRRNRLLE